MEATRLNKYLSQCGVCSRREADRLIKEGKVTVNGRRAGVGDSVRDTDEVVVNGRLLSGKEKKAVLAFYKPVGVTCTEKDPYAEKIINDFIRYPVRVTYAGRLDKDSEGLLLLTNDGELIEAAMRGANRHEKEYVVKVGKEITEDFLGRMSQGIYLKELKTRTRACKTEKMGKYTFRIVLTQGLNRQIRRMCKELGYEVTHLKRVRVMNIRIDGLKPGSFREITGEELEALYHEAGILSGPGRV